MSKYSSKNLWFEITKNEDAEQGLPTFSVFFTAEDGCDDIGGHNIDKKELKQAELAAYEVMENVFEPIDDNTTLEECREALLGMGFKEGMAP